MFNLYDIDMTLDGDVQVADNGDLKLAGSADAVASQVLFLLMTDNGEYKPDPSWGANLGSLIGYANDDTRTMLAESLTLSQLDRAGLLYMKESITAVAAGNNMMVVVKLRGDVFGAAEGPTHIGLAVAFPYLSGEVVSAYRDVS